MSAVKIRIGYANGHVEERMLSEGVYRVGREVGDIVLGDPNVSTAHAQIEVRQGGAVVTDLGSTNGTYDPGGQRLGAPMLMQPNQPIRLGSSTLTLAPLFGGTAVMPQMPAMGMGGPGMGAPAMGGPGMCAPAMGGFGGPPAGPGYGPPAGGYGAAPPPGMNAPYAPPAAPLAFPAGAPVAVVMDFAQWPDRVIGYIVDHLLVSAALAVVVTIYFVFVLLLGAASSAAGSSDAANAIAAGSASTMCCLLGVGIPLASLGVGVWNRAFLVSKRGYSIGQGMRSLKVVDLQGNLLTFGTAFLRLLAQVGIAMIPLAGLLDLLWPLWDPARQTLHDKAVNSFVVYNRSR
ncbi:MAG TPA: RDD family protein [Polyangiaceae bacterium]|nr:RDD family protein [Polyangiaceae bacterium]